MELVKDVTKYRTEEDKEYLIKRLKIIEGQVRGIMGMITDDRYCSDILNQISAINKSLKSIGNKVLGEYLVTNLNNMISSKEKVDDIISLISRLN